MVSNTIYCIISMDRSLNYKFYFIYVLFINFINQMHCFLWIVSYILHFMHCIICAVIILLFALCASFINFHSIHFTTSTILFSLVQKKAQVQEENFSLDQSLTLKLLSTPPTTHRKLLSMFEAS